MKRTLLKTASGNRDDTAAWTAKTRLTMSSSLVAFVVAGSRLVSFFAAFKMYEIRAAPGRSRATILLATFHSLLRSKQSLPTWTCRTKLGSSECLCSEEMTSRLDSTDNVSKTSQAKRPRTYSNLASRSQLQHCLFLWSRHAQPSGQPVQTPSPKHHRD